MTTTEDIFAAVADGDRDKFCSLLATDGDLAAARNENRLSLLLWVLYHQKFEWLADLQPHLGNLDVFEASAIGDVERLTKLIAEDPGCVEELAPDGFRPLSLAAYFARVPAVELLVAKGADVNFQASGTGLTALHGAVAGHSVEAVNVLLNAGAKVDAKQFGGYTALMSAAANGLTEILDLLLENGADRALVDDEGNSAADLARLKGQDEIARLLSGESH